MTLEKIETLPNKAERTYWKRAIKVDPKKGLTPALVRRSKTLYGSNVLTVQNAKPMWLRILEHFKELITILLSVAGIISLVLGIITVVQHPSNLVEWLSLFLEFVIIVGIIFTDIFLSIRQTDKTDKALQTLKNMSAPTAKVIRGGKTKLISSANIVPGDIIVLDAGETIPADGILIASSLLQVNESMLTGESEEVLKDHNIVSSDYAAIGDRKDWVFSGTTIINGTGLARVEYTGMKTQIGNIAGLLDQEKPEPTPLQKQISFLSKIIGVIAVSICVITFILYMLAMTGYSFINIGGWGESLNVSVSLAIASIPETLLAVITIILSIAAQNLSTKNALVKKLAAIETLGSLSVVCTDKTGTLTKNVMSVTRVWETKYPIQLFNTTRSVNDDLSIFKYGTLCSDAQIYVERGKTKYIGDPTETAILKGYTKQGGNVNKLHEKFQRIADIPFDADRKMMTVVVPSDKPEFKYMIITKGAPDRIIKKVEHPSVNHISDANKFNEEMGSQALRVLAVAIRYVNELPKTISPTTLEHKFTLIGLLGIIDPPRPEALVSINELKAAGIRTVMITGDHQTTATAIAKELKILRRGDKVISSIELSKLSDEELAQNIEQYSVFARVSPADKLRIVNAWKANGKIVSMTGDGVNDAPSLKAASVGCAMGSGTDVAKDASALVLADDNFGTIASSIDIGRRVILNIKSALTMLLTANLANFLAIFLGILVFFISPIKSLQILFINVAVETTLSFAIARNVRHEDVMSFKPRNPKQNIVDMKMLIQIIIFGSLIAAMSLFVFYIGLVNNSSYGFNIVNFYYDVQQYNSLGTSGTYIIGSYQAFINQYNFASLLSFLTIGLCLSINGLYARTGKSLFLQKFKDSKRMLLSVTISIIGIAFVSLVPAVNNLFNMGFWNNAELLKYANYNYVFIYPFICLAIFILINEIYRLIFNSLFNVDGSRRVKGELIEEEIIDDNNVSEIIVSEVAKQKPKSSSNATKSSVKKTTSTKSIESKTAAETKPAGIESSDSETEKSKKLRVSKLKFGQAGVNIETLINDTNTKIKTRERETKTTKKSK